MKKEKIILAAVPVDELLAGLAEEAAELAQAALKYRRALTGINPTPVSVEEAQEGVMEEVADVYLYLNLLLPQDGGSILRLYERQHEKAQRWVDRLQGKEDA